MNVRNLQFLPNCNEKYEMLENYINVNLCLHFLQAILFIYFP